MATFFFGKKFSTAAWFWIIAGAATLARIVLLVLSPAELGPDEAQYWFWSRDFDLGYFSKPPLIAWAIGLTTALFGNAEWAVRLTAPLLHLGTASFIYLLSRRAYGGTVGLWTGIAWLVAPGVNLSSFIIATDAPLLFFWSGALYFLYRLYEQRDTAGRRWLGFAALGLMIGLGMLSKYAMVYFPIALVPALAWSPNLRAALLRRELFLTAGLAALLIAPNIVWNASHDFQTFSHTADNAGWNTPPFHPLNLLKFLGSQLIVFGVILAPAFVWLLARPGKVSYGEGKAEFERALLTLALTPLAIICVQAFISTAYANWAATAYPATIILVTAWLFRIGGAWIAKASVALHAGLALIFAAAMINFNLIDQVGASRAVKDVRGWRAQTDMIASKADGYDAVVIDERYLVGEALYYQRESDFEIVAIDVNQYTENHYEAFKAFDPARHDHVLFVSIRDDAAHVDYRFRNITPLGPVTVEIGGLERTFHMFDISGYYGPGAPEERAAPSAPNAAPR